MFVSWQIQWLSRCFCDFLLMFDIDVVQVLLRAGAILLVH